MPLHANWERCPAHFDRVAIYQCQDPALYAQLCILESARNPTFSWYRREEASDCFFHNQPIIKKLAFLTMDLGLGKVTEKNVDEWWFRLNYAQRVGFLSSDEVTISVFLFPDERAEGCPTDCWGEKEITKEDLISCVGLSTNVSKQSRSAWLKRVSNYVAKTVEDSLRERD